MFALVHKQRVILGPINWNRALFDANLSKLKINYGLPRVAPSQLPVQINQDTAIYTVEDVQPEYNSKINYLEGPYWTIESDRAVSSYIVRDQPIDAVKNNLKTQAAAARWDKEVAGTTVTIQDTQVTVDTARGSRDIFVQKYLLMNDQETVAWKFPEGWLTLTKTELGQVVQAGATHVQQAFGWEVAKSQEIDACTSLAELDAVVIVEQPVEPQIQPE